MFKNYTYLAIIPARGGSKGIPKKNIVPLGGKPMIAYSIEAALQSKYIDHTIVSTDDEKIAQISSNYGANVIMRPPELAKDTSVTIDVLLHVIKALETEYDFLVLLQPTSPLRLSKHIDEAIELFQSNGNKSLVSVSLVNDHPLLIRTVDDTGKLNKLFSKNSTVRRQDMPKYYRINGAIYINKISHIHAKTSLNDNQTAYIMPQEFSVDIDEPIDLFIAEAVQKYLMIED